MKWNVAQSSVLRRTEDDEPGHGPVLHSSCRGTGCVNLPSEEAGAYVGDARKERMRTRVSPTDRPLQYATLSVVYVPFIPLASLLVVNLLEPLLQPTVP